MNGPVEEAIVAFQQSMSTLQSTFLASNLIGAQSVLRTIRASNTLENAKAAWGRPLNLPGRGSSSSDSANTDESTTEGLKKRNVDQRGEARHEKAAPSAGMYYSHQELWGRSERAPRTPKYGKGSHNEVLVRRYQRMVISAEEARVGRPFVG